MSRQKRPGPRNWLRCGWLAVGMLGGCTHNHLLMNGGYGPHRTKDDVIPPEPLGTFTHQWQDEHAAKAEASDFTIFLNEWYMGGLELGPFGQQHLTNIAGRLPTCVYPVVIEPTMDKALNQKRRELIVTALLNMGVTDAEARVILAYPQAESLPGEEGEINYYQMLQTTRFRTGYGYGGFGGGGFGGGWGGSFGGGFGGGWGGSFGGGWGGRGIYRGGYGGHMAGFGGGWGGGYGGGYGGRGGYFGY